MKSARALPLAVSIKRKRKNRRRKVPAHPALFVFSCIHASVTRNHGVRNVPPGSIRGIGEANTYSGSQVFKDGRSYDLAKIVAEKLRVFDP